MTSTAELLLCEALTLNVDDRAALATLLMDNLDSEMED